MRYRNPDIIELFTVPVADILSHLGYSDRHHGDMFSPLSGTRSVRRFISTIRQTYGTIMVPVWEVESWIW
jgi:hypothetical protein